jgi:molybdopterin molybdotransferase
MPKERYIFKYTPLKEAIEKTISMVDVRLDITSVRTKDAMNTLLAEDIIAPSDVPPSSRSEVDGYAVRSKDLMGATTSSPTELELASSPDAPDEGTCSLISTGEYLPIAFDAVCMEEYTERVDRRVRFYRSVYKFENISPRGLDFNRGETILEKGKPLTEFDVAALAIVNVPSVKVYRKPFIGILNTGSELVPLGQKVGIQEKINSNEIMLHSLLTNTSFNPLKLGIVGDDVREISERLSRGLRLCDALLTTGGTAVSQRDVIIKALERAGAEIVVRGIAMRPGRPTGSAVLGGKPIFTLSGNPVSCAVGYLFFTLPALQRIFHVREVPLPTISGILTRRVTCPPSFRCFVRVRVREERGVLVEPLALRGASLISTLLKADGFLEVPEHLEGFDEGDVVEVKLFRVLESSYASNRSWRFEKTEEDS